MKLTRLTVRGTFKQSVKNAGASLLAVFCAFQPRAKSVEQYESSDWLQLQCGSGRQWTVRCQPVSRQHWTRHRRMVRCKGVRRHPRRRKMRHGNLAGGQK